MKRDDEEHEAQDEREEGEAPDNVVRVNFGRSQNVAAEEEEAQLNAPEDPLADEKLRIFSDFIDQGMVMVTLDTRVPGVRVPPQFAGVADLRLNFSHRFFIEDFVYDEEGVRGSLSFGGKAFYCAVPWQAVYMMFSHEQEAVAMFDPPGL